MNVAEVQIQMYRCANEIYRFPFRQREWSKDTYYQTEQSKGTLLRTERSNSSAREKLTLVHEFIMGIKGGHESITPDQALYKFRGSNSVDRRS